MIFRSICWAKLILKLGRKRYKKKKNGMALDFMDNNASKNQMNDS